MIRSRRIRLRRLERADADLYRRWVGSSQARRFLYPRGLDAARVEEQFAGDLTGGEALVLVVETTGGQPVGYVHYVFDDDRSAELSVLIGEPEWERLGYGVHALALAIAFAFKELNLHRVSARYYDTNQNVMAMARRMGGTCEGVLRHGAVVDSQPVDFHCLAFLQDEENRQAQALSHRLLELNLAEFEA